MALVVGVDGGTEGLRAGVYRCSDGTELGYASAPYATSYPHPSWAEQAPDDWWTALGAAVRGALRAAAAAHGGDPAASVAALCCDTTCCSVVALDSAGRPLRPCLLWMDVRAAEQAAQLARCGDGALRVNGGGKGAVSAEWMVPKAMWLKQRERATYDAAAHICEYQDYLNLRLTGRYVASACNASVRWHWRGGSEPPLSMLAAVGMEDLAAKWPRVALPPGAHVGGLLAGCLLGWVMLHPRHGAHHKVVGFVLAALIAGGSFVGALVVADHKYPGCITRNGDVLCPRPASSGLS